MWIILGTAAYVKTWGGTSFDLGARTTNTESGVGITYTSDKESVTLSSVQNVSKKAAKADGYQIRIADNKNSKTKTVKIIR